jgi:hypothetical protein
MAKAIKMGYLRLVVPVIDTSFTKDFALGEIEMLIDSWLNQGPKIGSNQLQFIFVKPEMVMVEGTSKAN